MTLRILAACLGLASARAPAARPFTVEDLIQAESFGQAAFDPSGRWLVYERRAPHAQAVSFAVEPHSEAAEGQLRQVDLSRRGPPKPLLRGDPTGLTLGPFSPDGARVAIYALTPSAWRLGVVTLATGRADWFDLAPEYPAVGRTVRWLDPQTLLLIARDAGTLPRPLRIGGTAATELPRRWAATARGEAAATAIGSGRFQAVSPPPTARTLVRLDVTTGEILVLARGAFEDLEVSPDGRQVALISTAQDIPLAADRPVQGPWGTATQRRRLALLDLASGRLLHICPGLDVLGGLLSWAPSGRRLLVFARRDGEPWSAGRFLSVTADTGAVTAAALGAFGPALSFRPERVRAVWLGETPVVLAQDQDGREAWVAATGPNAKPLTTRFRTPPDDLQPAGDALLAIADGGAWRLTLQGAVPLGLSTGLSPAPPPSFALELRTLSNPPGQRDRVEGRRVTGETAWAVSIGADGVKTQVRLPAVDSRVLAFDPERGRAVSLTTDEHGVGTLWLSRDQRQQVLDRANTHLADIDLPRVLKVDPAPGALVPGAPGAQSWLYLPPPEGRGPPPLIVVPYPGAQFASAPTMRDFLRSAFAPSVPAMLGQGYAVLVPSLRIDAGREPVEGLAARILGLVDAAAAQAPGAFDPQRLAIWGHSYGGYAAMAAIAQSGRFRTAIEAAGPADLVSQWGVFAPPWRIDPSDGLGVAWNAGWTETAQGSMGGPPWADPMRYVRNSPLFQADRIKTPLLMLQGDQDEIALGQAEEMFSALFRQGRDAVLVTYWGEGHVIRSPGNLRDLYRRAFDWLAAGLNPEPADTAAATPRCPERSPATSGRRSPPPQR